MLMAILNVEQARSSNVKRDQPNQNLLAIGILQNFFFIDFSVKLSIFSNRGGHV